MTAAHRSRWLCVVLVGMMFVPSLFAQTTADPVAPALRNSGQRGQVRSIADRRTADGLLKRARQAIEQGNVDLAEWYVGRAEALNVKYDSVFQRFADTPTKVREAIAVLRRTGQAPPPPAAAQPDRLPEDYTRRRPCRRCSASGASSEGQPQGPGCPVSPRGTHGLGRRRRERGGCLVSKSFGDPGRIHAGRIFTD